MRWIFFPPVISLVFLIITTLFHDRMAAMPLPSQIWGMTVGAYVCLCALSLYHLVRDEDKYNAGLSALAQGLIISVMSLQLGVMFMSWIGLVLFLTGLLITFFYATRESAQIPMLAPMIAAEESDDGVFKRVDSLIEKLAFPICYTDNTGVIAGATTKFLEALGSPKEEVLGNIINDLLPIDDEEIMLDSGKWTITQKKEGARFYFSLTPILAEKTAAAALRPNAQASVMLFDDATGLFTNEYRKIRGIQEVSRSQRYKRPLSGLLLQLEFEPNPEVSLTEEQRAMLEAAFKTKVVSVLRTTDCGFLLEDGKIEVLMPETPIAGAKTLFNKLTALTQDVFDEGIRTAVNPRVAGGMTFFNGSTKMDYTAFSMALEDTLAKHKQSVASGKSKNKAASPV